MRVKVTADIHGDIEAVVTEAADCDLLVICGDLINIIDYRDGTGIFADVYGPDTTREWAEFRRKGEFERARSLMARVTEGRTNELRALFVQKVEEAHDEFCSRLPSNVVLTYGNVDVPDLIRKYIPSGVRFLDAESTVIAGERWGFVGGGLAKAGIPGEISNEEFRRKLDAVGEVDVLCVHPPPALPGLNHDVVAGNDEFGSPELVSYMETHSTRLVYYGHVHQPEVDRVTHHGTHALNVGSIFRATRGAVVHETP